MANNSARVFARMTEDVLKSVSGVERRWSCGIQIGMPALTATPTPERLVGCFMSTNSTRPSDLASNVRHLDEHGYDSSSEAVAGADAIRMSTKADQLPSATTAFRRHARHPGRLPPMRSYADICRHQRSCDPIRTLCAPDGGHLHILRASGTRGGNSIEWCVPAGRRMRS